LDESRPTLKIFTHEIVFAIGDPKIIEFRACDPVCKEKYIDTRGNRGDPGKTL